MSKKSRYKIGIDLGTSNCALAYVDQLQVELGPQLLQIEQWQDSSQRVQIPTLPSFCYIAPKKTKNLALPSWDESQDPNYVLGHAAHAQVDLTPERVVRTAKSWLSCRHLERQSPFLPWQSTVVLGKDRVSPVQVSAYYLKHLRQEWDRQMALHEPAYEFTNQSIALTVPASFDEVASQLTLAAAKEAGYPDVQLIEEPLAAFYYWREQDQANNGIVLVCDIGGGTSDFSLLQLTGNEAKRLDVSEHILLGGDNIDQQLAHNLESRHKQMSARDFAILVHKARLLKETALGPKPKESYKVAFSSGRGSLLKGASSINISHAELTELIVEGFFPECEKDTLASHSGIQQWGLPYAQDSRITAHLAEFVAGRKIDALLCTGGSLKPDFLQQRLQQQIGRWQDKPPELLHNPAMDFAVAMGAAIYTQRRDSQQRLVQANYPRSLYVAIGGGGAAEQLLCLVAKDSPAGQTRKLADLGVKLLLGQPASFQLYYAMHREADQPGEIYEKSEEFKPLALIETVLGKSKKNSPAVEIALEVTILSTGLLNLDCVAAAGKWHLCFNLSDKQDRSSSSSTATAAVLPEAVPGLILKVFGKKSASPPKGLGKELELALGKERGDWDLSLLRQLWPLLYQGESKRARSEDHEHIWLNLSGFVLRPGFGDSQDPLKVKQLWPCFNAGMQFPQSRGVQVQWWIMWRRVAGALDAKQQGKIFAKIFPSIKKDQALGEMYLLAGSLERVGVEDKIRLARAIIQTLGKRELHQKLWALGRILSRQLLYTGGELVIPAPQASELVQQVLDLGLKQPSRSLSGLYAQAGRYVRERGLDLSLEMRQELGRVLRGFKASADLVEPLETYVPMDRAGQQRLLGEALPLGFIVDA